MKVSTKPEQDHKADVRDSRTLSFMSNQSIPWKRLSVEAVAIVASILLAFAIDAWWNNRQSRLEIQDTIENLTVEFGDAADEFARVIAGNKTVIESADRILEALDSQSGSVTIDVDDFARLFMTPTINPQRGVLDGLITSGKIGAVPNDERRRSLANWPAILDDLIEEEKAAQTFVHEHLMRVLPSQVDSSAAFQLLINERIAAHTALGLPADTEYLLIHPIPNTTIQAERSIELIGLVQTRKFLSQYVLFDFSLLLDEYQTIIDNLESTSE
jgi:hypothetical protein